MGRPVRSGNSKVEPANGQRGTVNDDARDGCHDDETDSSDRSPGRTRPARDVVIPLVLASCAFAVGGAFMKPSGGFTRLVPSGIVIACFLLGAIGMTLAVHRGSLGTTYLVGLGLEAIAAVGIGVGALGERLSSEQTDGIVLVISGLLLVRL